MYNSNPPVGSMNSTNASILMDRQVVPVYSATPAQTPPSIRRVGCRCNLCLMRVSGGIDACRELRKQHDFNPEAVCGVPLGLDIDLSSRRQQA